MVSAPNGLLTTTKFVNTSVRSGSTSSMAARCTSSRTPWTSSHARGGGFVVPSEPMTDRIGRLVRWLSTTTT